MTDPFEGSTADATETAGPAPRWTLARVMGPVVAVVTVGAALLVPLTGNLYYMDLVQLIALYYVVVAGLNVVSGYAGQLSVGHGALFGAGAYISAILTTRYDQPFWVGFVGAVVGVLVMGLMLGVPSLRLAHLYFAMMTLGFAIVFSQVLLNWQAVTGGYLGIIGVPPVSLFGQDLRGDQLYYFIVGFAVVAGLLVTLVLRGRRGLWWRIVHDDEVSARAIGLSPSRSKLTAFAISAVLAGAAGSVYASFILVLQPDTFDLHLGLVLLVMMLLGGSGSLWGPLIGVPLMLLIDNLAPSGTATYAVGAALIVLTILMPRGAAGLVAVLSDRIQERRMGSVVTAVPNISGPNERQPVPRDSATILEGSGLKKRYGGVAALDGVDLVARAGSVHAVIGPNGCGKTTLLNVLLGLARSEEGAVRLEGEDVTRRSAQYGARRGIGRTFQQPRLSPELTVWENVYAAATAPGPEGDPARRAHEALATAGVTHLAHRKAADIPHAILRFVEIARVLSRRPTVVLMDEPAGGLTGEALSSLGALIATMRAQGVAIVLVEHNVPFVMGAADEVSVMESGRMIAHGGPAEIRRNPAVIAAYLGS
ncbi:ABC transporter permease subunit [Nocardioides gansuensis]|uniref:branched-chain amino acid ABC transporter ATP-binding protein/permease n=1 Tax=Nocardioides gansuensis TaxID=2138300 RepID=UPI0010581BDD|nr:branched-chain amino acid ABC transporter ATP-binding protein/permease [Nocardioides gansuensis]